VLPDANATIFCDIVSAIVATDVRGDGFSYASPD
jgi:hypothetical protein